MGFFSVQGLSLSVCVVSMKGVVVCGGFVTSLNPLLWQPQAVAPKINKVIFEQTEVQSCGL